MSTDVVGGGEGVAAAGDDASRADGGTAATAESGQGILFAVALTTRPPVEAPPSDPKRGARLREAQRTQMAWGRIDLDAQLPEEHGVRAIWAVIDRLDLSELYAQIEARDEVAGAPAIDPKILVALWVYATSEGEGSAREIWRLTQEHAAYRWICGGVEVGYHDLTPNRGLQPAAEAAP